MSLFEDATKRALGAIGMGEEQPIKDSRDQPQEDQDLASWVKKKIEESRTAANRVAHEGIWMSNIAAVMGFSNASYNTQTRMFQNVNNAVPFQRRNELVSNQILPAVQNRLARLTKNPPKYEIRPESNAPEDKDKARLSYDVLLDLYEKQEIQRKRIPLVMWVQQAGHAYIKVSYDPLLGDPMINPYPNQDKTEFTGDVRADVIAPFEVFPDPLAKSFDELQWLGHCKVRHLDYFRTHYGDLGKAVKAEGNWLQSLQYEQRINSLNTTGASLPGAGNTSQAFKNTAVEVCYYEKRSSLYPNGRLIIIANGIVLKNDELPCGEIPFAMFADVVIGGKYYPESLVTHARPLQQQYNRNQTKAAQWLNSTLGGKWSAEKRHGLAKEALNDSTEVIEYNYIPGAPPPASIPVPQLPNYWFEHTGQIKRDISDVFGLSDVSQGRLPSSSIPAMGMQLLVEQDQTRIGVEVEQHEHAFARVGMLMLKYASKFYKTNRKLKKKNKAGDFVVQEYKGEDLGYEFDVKVVRGSMIPTSESMRRQDILNEFQLGLLGNPQDPLVRQNVHEWIEFGERTEMWREISLQKGQVIKTIEQMEKGIVPEVNKMDNHALHVKMKNDFRLTDRYEAWPEPSRELLIDDIERHVAEQVNLQNPGLKSQIEEAHANLADLDNQELALDSNMPENEISGEIPPPLDLPPEGI